MAFGSQPTTQQEELPIMTYEWRIARSEGITWSGVCRLETGEEGHFLDPAVAQGGKAATIFQTGPTWV
jgi:hypothetical protein